MLHLLTSPSTARRALRAVVDTITDTITDTATAVADTWTAATDHARTTEAPAAATDPDGLYEPDEMPEVADIERAALSYDLACDNARRADRGKRAAKKILSKLPAGRYGNWIVERVTSNRQTADLDKIRAIFKANGLGQVPMRDAQPSLKVRRAEFVPADAEATELAGVAA